MQNYSGSQLHELQGRGFGIVPLHCVALNYLPDVLIVDPNALKSEPLREKAATIARGISIILVATLHRTTLSFNL